MAAWYKVFTMKTRAFILVVSFKLIIHLLPKRSTNAILMCSFDERWWDITYTFHIADREMTMTPHDFHCMTSLRCDEALINFEGELGIWLGIDLPKRRYSTKTIYYFDLETNYEPVP